MTSSGEITNKDKNAGPDTSDDTFYVRLDALRAGMMELRVTWTVSRKELNKAFYLAKHERRWNRGYDSDSNDDDVDEPDIQSPTFIMLADVIDCEIGPSGFLIHGIPHHENWWRDTRSISGTVSLLNHNFRLEQRAAQSEENGWTMNISSQAWSLNAMCKDLRAYQKKEDTVAISVFIQIGIPETDSFTKAKYFNEKLFSDVTVRLPPNRQNDDEVSESTQMPCHRIVLAQSPVFKGLLTHSCKESAEKCIDLSGYSYHAVYALLQYLYLRKCHSVDVNEWTEWADIYMFAHMHEQSGLMEFAACHLISGLNSKNIACAQKLTADAGNVLDRFGPPDQYIHVQFAHRVSDFSRNHKLPAPTSSSSSSVMPNTTSSHASRIQSQLSSRSRSRSRSRDRIPRTSRERSPRGKSPETQVRTAL